MQRMMTRIVVTTGLFCTLGATSSWGQRPPSNDVSDNLANTDSGTGALYFNTTGSNTAAGGTGALATAPVAVADNPRETTDPCGASAAPATMVLCGTATSYWQNGGFGVPGLEVWRDEL